ncbi:MAG: type IV-A pilus assembly ATPase PilB [bacterium]
MGGNNTAVFGLSGLARRLVQMDILESEAALDAHEKAAKQKLSLVTYLIDHDLAPAGEVAHAASLEFGVPIFDIESLNLEHAPVSLVDEKLITRHHALPLYKRGSRLFVGVSDPTNLRALDEIKFQTNLGVEPISVRDDHLTAAIDQALESADSGFGGMEDEEGLEDLELEDLNAEDEDDSSGVDLGGDDTPVVRFVNKVLVDAIRRGASDIHFEPYEKVYRVRLRIDGMLRAVASPPTKMAMRIAARIKVMASLDIAERRIPQDGRIKLNLSKNKSIDFRVSTCPTLFGEKVVLRILDASAAKMGIEMLGYEDDQRAIFEKTIQNPYGMVLVTGPTGSGKTVSLYTALNILNEESRNISTVEDPVEIRVSGINQVQQDTKKGMTFAAALRSFLRQDPDVVMVGEIRDLETAEIAVKAAQTGHMVLSTLHTNDAPQTIARLMNMGIAPFNISSSVSLVIAQRLARRLHDCKKAVTLPEEALLKEGFKKEELEDLVIYEPVGCNACTEGYKGRVGIYQVMPMTENIQKIILEGGNALQIAAVAEKEGVNNLRASALNKVRAGIIGLTELNRVTKD